MVLLLLLAAQIEPAATAESSPDSLPSDTIIQDSFKAGVSVVKFGADTLIFYPEEERVLLLWNGWVEYGETEVHSDSITFSTSERLLTAHKEAELHSGRDVVTGSILHYAVETGKGMMEEGRTRIEDGYFYGKGVWLVEEDVLLIKNGYYTTCELTPPHYDFYGLQLKVLIDDMVISKPIFLRINLLRRLKLPILAAPFWYLPIGTDRKSGIMPFKVGHNSQEGWYAKQVRYYWVPNDYTDATFSLDILSELGFRPGALFNWEYGPQSAPYVQGRLSGNYINEPTGSGQRQRRWTINLRNTSYLPDGTVAKASINYVSDSTYLEDYIEDPDSTNLVIDREQHTHSEISLSRELFGRGLSLSADRDDDLATGSWDMTLPTFSFSWPTVNLWDFFSLGFGRFRISNDYSHDVQWIQDTLSADSALQAEDTRSTSFNQPLNLNWSYKFFSAYTYNQSYSAGQSLQWNTDAAGVDTLIRGGSYNFSHGFSTELYRLFGIYALGMNGLLHTVTPRISHSLTPRTETIHPWLVYPRFDTTLYSHNVTFSIGQSFQTKLTDRRDTTRLRKQNLIDLSTSISYNLLTDSLGTVDARIYLPSGMPVTANASVSYNIYTDSFTVSTYVTADIDDIVFPLFGLRKREETVSLEDTTSAPDSLGMMEDAWLDSMFSADTLTDTLDSLVGDSVPDMKKEAEETFLERFSKSRISITDNWTMNGDHMLSLASTLYLPWGIDLGLSASTNLTEAKSTWQDYLANYNIEVVKSLHCWEMVFEMRPVPRAGARDSIDWSIYFRITEIPDIQLGKGVLKQLGWE
ncbi:hypothetical protein GF359_07200 [candidate division WOR-3 bacterium]|uniref:LPS-assembly protein LptD central domain-containing protein n=1 Tax=candidate division WOR-3 bacterium TaxID=2052148 RepID=A0A9D5KC33_UNCW3|nr:hypothetical protein [candidate division WOR-3 bacterium]MBD3364986.1 hypothetical protein [candidate division WOR-3 bacterium]